MRIAKKLATALALALSIALLCGTTVFASGTPTDAGQGDVATVIQTTWTVAAAQIKSVVNMVVFPAVDLILAVFFFIKLGTSYFEYRKHGSFEWAAPSILFASLVFTLTAPLYVWQILGI